ncbi:MAG: glycosyltransferase [Bacteroidales bacterium]|nr:glycosyltransferase [Bacteroidales bacterium]
MNHPRKFIYAGSPGLNFSKDDIETIVRTFLSIDQKYELLFYGFTIDDFLKNYPQYEQKLRAKKEIHFMGRVSKRIINEALSSSDFYVLYRPNTKVNKVGFSTKSMEAISSCVPLIANDVNGDFNLYFQQNQALISPVDDYDSFANNVVSAINMPDEDVIKMKNNCAQYNPFAMEQYVESMNTFMERLK